MIKRKNAPPIIRAIHEKDRGKSDPNASEQKVRVAVKREDQKDHLPFPDSVPEWSNGTG